MIMTTRFTEDLYQGSSTQSVSGMDGSGLIEPEAGMAWENGVDSLGDETSRSMGSAGSR